MSLEQATKTDPGSVDQELESAWAHYRSDRLDEAKAILSQFWRRSLSEVLPSEKHGDALQLYGLVLHDLGQVEESIKVFHRAELATALTDVSQIALASCFAASGQHRQARELYLRLALSRRLPPPLMLEVASGLDVVGASSLAMEVCQRTLNADPTVAQAHYDLGFYSARSGQPLYLTEASIHRAIALAPENTQFRIGLANVLIQMNREGEAMAALEQVSSADLAQVDDESCLRRIAELLDRSAASVRADAFRRRANQIQRKANLGEKA
ncbi:MAG: tetratricopeptide repeat protein [Planctomycetota bacterium]